MTRYLASVHPYDSLSEEDLASLAARCSVADYLEGSTLFNSGDTLEHLFIIVSGEIEITDASGVQLSLLGPRNSFGERALLRGEAASRTATATGRLPR